MFLLDTNVVSELRKNRPHGAVLAWLNSVSSDDLHLCAVTIGEIQAGIEITRRQGEERAAEFERWLDTVIVAFKIVELDARIFRRWAVMMHRRSRDLSEDAMIAAAAQICGLTVVTRNIRDFEPFGVRVLNPFDYAAPAP